MIEVLPSTAPDPSAPRMDLNRFSQLLTDIENAFNDIPLNNRKQLRVCKNTYMTVIEHLLQDGKLSVLDYNLLKSTINFKYNKLADKLP